MLGYPARFDRDAGGGYVVTFRDIPEATTQGMTLDEARTAAQDALITAMDFYFEDARQVPEASQCESEEELVELPLSVATKVFLLNEMVARRLRPVDLASAMNVRPQEVTRILDLHHTTKIDTLGRAFEALGKRLELRVA